MKNFIQTVFLTALLAVGLYSCSDVLPGEVVDYNNFYQSADDADRAILGLYGQFSQLAAQVVVLNELRADMMDVTPNATTDLEKLNLNIIEKGNKWTDPTPFFKVIQTCNDILSNFDRMKKENILTDLEYEERYSDVGALRTWIYYQMSSIYGYVPYITEPIADMAQVEGYKDKLLDPDQMIAQLIDFMEKLPTLEDYRFSKLIEGNPNGYSFKPMFINKRCLLGDLYLTNNQYVQAAEQYRTVLSKNENTSSSDFQYYYRCRSYAFTNATGEPNWYAICSRDGYVEDEKSMVNSWKNMFGAKPGERSAGWEHVWWIAFNESLNSPNPFTSLFISDYMLAPSKYAMDSIWGQRQINQFPYDGRGLSSAYRNMGGTNRIIKYNAFPAGVNVPEGSTLFNRDGNWFLYRAGGIHLRYAEAANRAGYPKLAWALVNDGLGYHSRGGGDTFYFRRADGSVYPTDSIYYTGDSPTQPYPAPFYFDARNSATPRIITGWMDSYGVRGRVNMPNIYIPAGADTVAFVEKMIVREMGAELGFEGKRWSDLVRVARRMNKEQAGSGTHFLYDENLKHKYELSGITPPDMSNEQNWYLPLFQ